MPIIDLQRRLREIGRIRLGEQVPTDNGKKRPAKLTKFRLTSRDEAVLHAAAEMWGGTVAPWENDGPQFELYTDTNQMAVVIPPTEMAFSQWYEQWSAGGCQVRCDGGWDSIGDKACHCDPENRTCKITTRLSVMLPELPGLGVWRVETHGYYAAVELNGAVEVCQQFAGQGRMLPARLRLEARSVIRPDPRTGQARTHRFAVPVLDVDVHIGQLAAIAGSNAVAALPPAGAPELGPGFTPVPDALRGPSLAEQLDAVDNPPETPPRSNQRAPLPATGVAPRPASAAQPPPPADGGAPFCVACGETLAGSGAVERTEGGFRHKGGCPAPGETPKPVEDLPLDDPREDWDRQKRRFHAVAAKRWPGDKDAREAARHAWLAEHYAVDSLRDLDARQLAVAADALDQEVTAAATAPSGEQTFSWEDSHGNEGAWKAPTWRSFLTHCGIGGAAAVSEARDIARQLGEDEPERLEDLEGRPSLCVTLRAWCDEQREAGS